MKLTNDDFLGDLELCANEYFKHIIALSYSNNTISLYKRIISQFLIYSSNFQEKMRIKNIKTAYIVNFLDFLEKNSKNANVLSKKTKNTYLRVLSSFFNFISENNDNLYNFSFNFSKLKLKTNKAEEKLSYLNENEEKRLILYLDREKSKKNTYNAFRNSFLIKLMLYAGLRISEALNVKLDDFSLENENMFKISIIGKGIKEQYAYIKKDLIQEELEFFYENIKPDELIMKTKHNTKLNRSSAFIIINRIYTKAFIKKQGLHLLRHTLAMRLTEKGVNLVVIQKILRHTDIKTTTIYAKATTKSIDEALSLAVK